MRVAVAPHEVREPEGHGRLLDIIGAAVAHLLDEEDRVGHRHLRPRERAHVEVEAETAPRGVERVRGVPVAVVVVVPGAVVELLVGAELVLAEEAVPRGAGGVEVLVAGRFTPPSRVGLVIELVGTECRIRLGVFTGKLSGGKDVIALMKASRVFAIPSTREGFGISALEAMACGLPVVTSNDPMNAIGLLIDEKCGAVCDPDPRDLAEKLVIMLISAGENSGYCRKKAQAYDWYAITSRLEQYYNEVGSAGARAEGIKKFFDFRFHLI